MHCMGLAVLVFVAVTLVEQGARACTCLPPDPGRSYESADHVVHVRVYGVLAESDTARVYLARLLDDDFKGCWNAGRWLALRTATSSAACGITLQRGTQYLLYGRNDGRAWGLRALRVGLCDANTSWNELPPEHLTFLESRYVCCGGECACTDGSQPVNCLVDPCEVSSCDVEGATCVANYCGGCNAEWYDGTGALVCQPGACTYDEPNRSYVARSPEACATIRFLCAEGYRPFFDECGCGCENPCRVAGCSGQLCVGPGEPTVTTCEWRSEYACYRGATCQLQSPDECGWSMTPELEACLAAPPPLE